MRFTILFLGVLCLPKWMFGQGLKIPSDSLYVEDQFYLGVQYNSIQKNGASIVNIGFPYVLNVGFIRDIPINKKRNQAIGIGIGYQYDVLKPSIALKLQNGQEIFTTDGNFTQYEYRQQQLVFPIEYRWRNSTALKYEFWRVYSGISYVKNISNSIFYKDNEVGFSLKNATSLQKDKIALHATIGHGTWNAHVKYYLTPYVYQTVTAENKSIELHQIQLGLMFYVL